MSLALAISVWMRILARLQGLKVLFLTQGSAVLFKLRGANLNGHVLSLSSCTLLKFHLGPTDLKVSHD